MLVDPLLQHGSWTIPTSRAIEVTTLAGVTNSDVEAVLHAAATIGVDVQHAGTARRIEFDDSVDDATIDELVNRLVANPIVERWSHGTVDLGPADGRCGHGQRRGDHRAWPRRRRARRARSLPLALPRSSPNCA